MSNIKSVYTFPGRIKYAYIKGFWVIMRALKYMNNPFKNHPVGDKLPWLFGRLFVWVWCRILLFPNRRSESGSLSYMQLNSCTESATKGVGGGGGICHPTPYPYTTFLMIPSTRFYKYHDVGCSLAEIV